MNGPADRDPLAVLDPSDDPRLAEAPAVDGRAAAEQRARDDYHYENDRTRREFDAEYRGRMAQDLRRQADARFEQAEHRQDAVRNAYGRGDLAETARNELERNRLQAEAESLRDRARLVEGGVGVGDVELTGNDWERVNESWSDLAPGPVETGDRSALTGDDRPRSVDTTRRYHHRGGLRPPLRIHQTDLERAMPRDGHGNVIRQADPRDGEWFGLVNDGGPEADPTRSINCGDTVLSLFETYMHGRPRVSAPRTFDGYQDGDPTRPTGAEQGVSARIEATTGGRFEGLTDVGGLDPDEARVQVRMAEIRLRSHLTDLGHGSFAFITTQDQAGRTHAFAAVNQNGTILYLDPQTRQVSSFAPIHTHSGLGAPCDVLRMDALVVDGQADPRPLTDGTGSHIAEDPAGKSKARNRAPKDDEPARPLTPHEKWLASLPLGTEVPNSRFEGCPIPVTSKVTTDEHGKRVIRNYIDKVDDLLAVAEFLTGGNLGDYQDLEKDYYRGQDPGGNWQKIEVNPKGHSDTGEGPHVKLMSLREPERGLASRWKTDEKVFVKYRERLPRR